ncbi:uncharacterized protein F4822DRAFT_392368 [Hypoxylon trugodes]|uniref:uncharacterized protein n=1 Tax=Hypoxylon trugodes TaxID=326681 RepID=UPI00219FF5AA|nr:uncharacterized protein F4822DRAFT_392368 [Hypoxylon trugodes]KAI1392841.1 hypothetical protein F4822DRAFT_392368 [Hypoxylon trugodes]
MSLRPLVSSNDPRLHKDDDPPFVKNSTRKNMTTGQLDGPIASVESRQTTPAPILSPVSQQRRHVVIPDPVAFRYLEEDPSVTVEQRRQKLQGYELYLVEQWACSRQSPTLVIVTYTGDEKHYVVVGVLGVPADEKAWTPKLRLYFKAIQQFHARPKDTELGELMVTNLSSFPSALTVIPVPDGDIKEHRKEFIVNEDLKRLGCSGRSGMTLSEPASAARAKFYQLYKTTDKVPFSDAVVELVKMCQVALLLFGKLDQVYIDGLLCDITETAIGDWWTEFGAEYYSIEPTDGILGPTTVAALLGLLMGARNRLSYFGAPVPKDVFDIDAMERGIAHFQKYQKLEKRSRRLDRQTMHKLHSVTAKAAAGEGWGVQKAVKSTMTEIGGKRGEIVLGMVGGRDKGGIGDIETSELERLISMASGERMKWLFFGKPKRSTADNHERPMPDMSNILFGKDDVSSQVKRTHTGPPEEEIEARRREDTPGVYSTPAPGSAVSVVDSPGEKETLRRGLKNVARDARSGFGRIKDAMYSGGGLRGHTSRPSKDESSETTISGPRSSVLTDSSAGLGSPSPVPGQVGRAFTWRNKPEEYLSVMRRERDIESAPASVALLGTEDSPPKEPRSAARMNGDAHKLMNGDIKRVSQAAEIRSEVAAVVESSVADSVVAESDLQGPFVDAEQQFTTAPPSLYRRHSVGDLQSSERFSFNEARWPRRLSFGDAEEAVLRWEEVADLDQDDGLDNIAALEKHSYLTELARSLYVDIIDVKQGIAPWVDAKIESIEKLDDHYAQQQEDLQALYDQRAHAYRRAKENSQETIAEQRAHITEALGEVGVQAAKLEYEINALVSRVQDVEDGVAQFEMQVDDVERRAEELKTQLETESWLHWAVRTLTGIGTGPNITRERR